MNARFWDIVNGSTVKIKLKPGQALSWSKCWRHEAGWSREAITFRHNGEGVEVESLADGRDCDGYGSTTSSSYCPVANLSKGSIREGVRFPLWQDPEVEVYDQFAQSAGY